jgi:hypothetical protein
VYVRNRPASSLLSLLYPFLFPLCVFIYQTYDFIVCFIFIKLVCCLSSLKSKTNLFIFWILS